MHHRHSIYTLLSNTLMLLSVAVLAVAALWSGVTACCDGNIRRCITVGIPPSSECGCITNTGQSNVIYSMYRVASGDNILRQVRNSPPPNPDCYYLPRRSTSITITYDIVCRLSDGRFAIRTCSYTGSLREECDASETNEAIVLRCDPCFYQ